jgi:hypothetical protein
MTTKPASKGALVKALASSKARPGWNPVKPIVGAAKAVGHAASKAERKAEDYVTNYDPRSHPLPQKITHEDLPAPKPKPKPDTGFRSADLKNRTR